MHLRDIEQFMAGHHLTYVVRNEDELDINLILEKVSKVTASSFNFKQKPTGESELNDGFFRINMLIIFFFKEWNIVQPQ